MVTFVEALVFLPLDGLAGRVESFLALGFATGVAAMGSVGVGAIQVEGPRWFNQRYQSRMVRGESMVAKASLVHTH